MNKYDAAWNTGVEAPLPDTSPEVELITNAEELAADDAILRYITPENIAQTTLRGLRTIEREHRDGESDAPRETSSPSKEQVVERISVLAGLELLRGQLNMRKMAEAYVRVAQINRGAARYYRSTEGGIIQHRMQALESILFGAINSMQVDLGHRIGKHTKNENIGKQARAAQIGEPSKRQRERGNLGTNWENMLADARAACDNVKLKVETRADAKKYPQLKYPLSKSQAAALVKVLDAEEVRYKRYPENSGLVNVEYLKGLDLKHVPLDEWREKIVGPLAAISAYLLDRTIPQLKDYLEANS